MKYKKIILYITISILIIASFSFLYAKHIKNNNNLKTNSEEESLKQENNNIEELRTNILEYLDYMNSEDFKNDMSSNLEEI